MFSIFKRFFFVLVLIVSFFSLSSFSNFTVSKISNTDAKYSNVEKVLVDNNNYSNQIVDFIQKNIVSKIPEKNTFLDIGAGPGYITSLLSKKFKSTTVIEPNTNYKDFYNKNGFISYNENFQNSKLTNKYDFVLCSHVLYYVDRNEWPSFLQKMYELIQKGGKGVIIVISPNGARHQLHSSINPNYCNSHEIELVLQKMNIPYEIAHSSPKTIFKSSNRVDFRNLLYMFTIDNCFTSKQFDKLSEKNKLTIAQKIEHFIDQSKQLDGNFTLVEENDYIIISK